MIEPSSHFLTGQPRLHYLQWRPNGARTLVLLHGNLANAWWWEAMAESMPPTLRLLALDQRGHGDSEWVRPPSYGSEEYAGDIARFVSRSAGEGAIVVGHSMGGMNALAFASRFTNHCAAVIAVDVGLTPRRSSQAVQRLRALPAVTYPDRETAAGRFRLMPEEGGIAPPVLKGVAYHSVGQTEEGRWALKFDRESFFLRNRADVLQSIRGVRVPLLLVRGENSRIMTAEATEEAVSLNPLARAVVIPGAHHHVPLERPAELAAAITEFVGALNL